MNAIQINPPLCLDTVKGHGMAHFLLIGSIEDSLRWVVFMESGQVWVVPNEDVRAIKNYSAFRPNPEKPA